jgi:DNA polymerase elongation subunit (family B)
MSKKQKIINNGVEWTKKEITFVRNKFKAGYSRNEISRAYKSRFSEEGLTRSPDSIKHCIEVYCQDIVLDVPRVLFLDVETKPNMAYVWQQYDNNIDLSMLIEDGSIMSFSAKWAGDPDSKIIYHDMRGKEKNLKNDKELMKKMLVLLEEADIVIGHNIIKFDIPKINERFIEHGFDAPSEYKIIDTLRLAKNNFSFFSNKLAYLSKKLAKKHKKDSHGEFPGFSLWSECMKGNKKAWNSMKKYNIIDTLALEEVFLELAKYTKNNKNVTSVLRCYGKKV